MTETSLDRRLGQVHQRIDAHEQRLGVQETRMNQLQVESAEHALNDQHIVTRLSEIQSGIVWLNRLVIGGIVGGAIAFVVAGGLNVSP